MRPISTIRSVRDESGGDLTLSFQIQSNLKEVFSGWILITHKYRGSQQFSISKSVEPNEELKVEQVFPQVLSTTDTTLRTLDVRFT